MVSIPSPAVREIVIGPVPPASRRVPAGGCAVLSAAGRDPATAGDPGADPFRPRRILIADDDPGIRELLEALLVDLGYDVDLATDGSEAIDMARVSPPAAILMDIMMPVVSGAEATAALKSDPDTRRIPVIAMSAGRNLATMANSIPADSFVSKPFDFDVLLEAIAYQIARGEA